MAISPTPGSVPRWRCTTPGSGVSGSGGRVWSQSERERRSPTSTPSIFRKRPP
jgi:hypothetical protein